MKVRDMMNGILLHADVTENLANVAGLMFRNNADAILIRKNGTPVGIITATDLIKVIMESKNPKSVKAGDIMTTPIVTVGHDADIDTARQLMVNKGVKQILVKQDIDVIGLLVQTDLIRDMSWHN